jgi:hypothetical protein
LRRSDPPFEDVLREAIREILVADRCLLRVWLIGWVVALLLVGIASFFAGEIYASK